MSTVGKLEPFHVGKDNWEMYIDRLEQYFIVNSIASEKKVATLITVMGSEAYELLVSLCTPSKPATKTFTELDAAMKSHLNPRPSLLAERYKFRQRIQKQSESIAEYVAELKRLTKDCGFKADSLLENLRDQFVCGLSSEEIRQRLFTESDTITYEKAYKIAVSMEAAEVNAALVVDGARNKNGDHVPTPGSSTSVYKVGQAGRERTTGSNRGGRGSQTGGGGSSTRGAREYPAVSGNGTSGDGGRFRRGGSNNRYNNTYDTQNGQCKTCGGDHESESCKFKMYVCRICNQEGHLKKMCPKWRRNYALHNLEHQQVVYPNAESDSDEVNNFSLKSDIDIRGYRPYTVNIFINDKMLNMEIDTGSAISCISLNCYQKLFSNCELLKSDLVLRYYTGEIIKPVGKILPIVKFNNKCKKLDLYIVESGKTSLLGRCWINELEVHIPIFPCNQVKESNESFNVEEFSSRYYEVFADGLGRYTGGTVGFHLREGARPVFLRARPMAYALREPVEHALEQMVRDGIITPVNTSDWATPIVPVMKKDGTIRVCADFKLTLNKCLEVDHYPIPKVEDLLTKLHGGEKFTKLDLSQAYAQFELDESKQYTVINTHKGLFMYNRLIYGLASSPGIFQRKLEQLFADMPRVGVFLDDLIITGEDDQSHLATLHEVFARLQRYGLKIKREKCTFFASSVTYLGFKISKHGVHTCTDKIDAINNVAVPRNVSELRSFLGLVMYYAKFVKNISSILAPLYKLLRKEVKYEWNDECMQAFNKVKNMLVGSEVLAHYSPELPLVLTTDASGVGVGAVISHLTSEGERPIAYASRVLNTAEKAYSQIEREALAIIYGVRKFHQYLYGRRFTLRTDHKPLVTIFGDKTGIPIMAASRMQRWAVILAGYDYSIEYVRSEKNAADALSRLPVGEGKHNSEETTYLNFVQNFLPVTRQTVQEQVVKDNILNKVILFIKSGWPNECKDEEMKPYFIRRNELYLDRDCIVWGYRVVIPSTLREHVLKELHVGHLGIVKMKGVARSIVWWPGIDNDIENTCRQCTTCALEGAAPPRAPPQPWPFNSEPWSRLHIDFLGPFHGRTFLVIIDSTTKWIEAFLMQRTTASAVIKVLRETFARFGLPKEVVSDNGPPFTSKEYFDFMKNNGVKVTLTAAYHPASNGAAENAVKLCKRAINKAVRDSCDVETALQTYLMIYRNCEQSTTGSSPAMLLQRRMLRSRLDLLREDRQLEARVKDTQQKQVLNAGGTDRDFKLGETVWARDFSGGKWIGGRVEDKLGSRNYIVGREGGPPIRRHVDQLKRRSSQRVPSAETIVSSPGRNSSVNDSVPQPVMGGKCDSDTMNTSSGSRTPPSVVHEVSPGTSSAKDPITTIAPTRDRPKRTIKPVKRYGIDVFT